MKIGYARVSSAGQSLELQVEALDKAGCEKIYQEKESGGSTNGRDQLQLALDQLRAGDELVVTRLDRLARSVLDLYAILQRVQLAGASFTCLLQSGIDVNSSTGKLMLGMLGVIAEFERDLIRERQRDGIAKRKAEGGYRGRKAQLDPDKVREAYEREGSYGKAALALGCSKASVERIVGNKPRIRSAAADPAASVLHGGDT